MASLPSVASSVSVGLVQCFLVVVVLCRVTLIVELLSPEREETAGEEANEADVDR